MDFKTFCEAITTKKVGIFPGAFKPPHVGHYQACAMASKTNDEVYVFISAQPRDMISGEVSKAIWDIFAQTFNNVVTILAPISPVKSAYELVDTLNKSPNANQIIVNLYADADDMPRYERMPKFSTNLAKVNLVKTPRVTSARIVREAISKGDWKTVIELMPQNVDVKSIIKILQVAK